MWTFTGRRFWPTDPHPDDICLEDIAHALACQNRFAGHTIKPYSVAQHCVLVSELCDPVDALLGVVHDASEAYIVDIPRPLKYSLGMENYIPIEAAVHRAICDRLGLPHEIPASVRAADDLICEAEMRDLMPALPHGWDALHGRVLAKQENVHMVPEVKPWTWEYARDEWLGRYFGLGGSHDTRGTLQGAHRRANACSSNGSTRPWTW